MFFHNFSTHRLIMFLSITHSHNFFSQFVFCHINVNCVNYFTNHCYELTTHDWFWLVIIKREIFLTKHDVLI